MPSKNESKHQAFLRLAHRRLERAREELRLISQLASPNYVNTPEEAEEIVRILDGDVRHVAEVFDVEYTTRIGESDTHTTNGAQLIGAALKKVSVLDELDIDRVIEHLRAGRIEEVEQILRSAVSGKRAD